LSSRQNILKSSIQEQPNYMKWHESRLAKIKSTYGYNGSESDVNEKR
jgi:hypothetical protein